MANIDISPFLAKNLSRVQTNFSGYPGFSFTFNFERLLLLTFERMRLFVSEHYILPFGLSALYYLVIVSYMTKWMANRPPNKMRTALLAWNTGLALFSILGSIRILPELIWRINNYGLFFSVCDNRYTDDTRVLLWIYLFNFSKVVEFGDTVFIVLRKQKLLTLHWIHHILTLCYTWYMMFELPSNSLWLSGMNLFIHSIMYSYYAVMASGRRIPKSLAQVITLLQILQMVVGLVTESIGLYYPEEVCRKSKALSLFGFMVYFVFLILFVKFFLDKYIVRHDDNRKSKSKKTN